MRTSQAALYPIAERQGGYFTTSQAHGAGISDQQLHYLAKSGSIERVAHGIYRLQRFPAQQFEDVIVACLWAGEGAVASHETALAIYGLTEAMPPVIHVTVPRSFRGKRKGVVVQTAPLREDERTTREGVPVTTPARTIRDIAVRYG
ncbi:MAG: type IV toxin-antitoxin system AbiEi family antitoxin domain-containing protein, partial [Actinomycetota bacterium]